MFFIVYINILIYTILYIVLYKDIISIKQIPDYSLFPRIDLESLPGTSESNFSKSHTSFVCQLPPKKNSIKENEITKLRQIKQRGIVRIVLAPALAGSRTWKVTVYISITVFPFFFLSLSCLMTQAHRFEGFAGNINVPRFMGR